MSKATGKDIRAAVARWQQWLGLEGWQLTVRIGKIAGGHRGICEADPVYREALLRFDPEAMRRHGDDVEEIACHEVLHCAVWKTHAEVQRLARSRPAEDKLCEVEEAEVTHLSRAFLKLAREGRLLPP